MSQAYSTYPTDGNLIPAQGIYEESTTQNAPLGTRLQVGERVFRYASNGTTALAAGKFVKSIVVPSSNINKAVAAAAATGDYTVTLTTSYAVTTAVDGYMQINDEAGEGLQYKIRLCEANADTSTSTDFTLYDPIITALTTSSEATIVYNQYQGLTIVSATTDRVMGVPPIPVTASTSSTTYYFWLQTWGPACILSEGTPPAGESVVHAISGSIGGVTTAIAAGGFGTGTTIPSVGRMMLVGVDTEYKPVYLTICP